MLVLGLAFIILVSDQWTKRWVLDGFALGESRDVIPGFFRLTYIRNTGAAWGLFGGHNNGLVLLSLLMLAALLLFRRSFLSPTPAHRIALGCMIGGIVGNLADRVRLGYVVDFLDFSKHFPAFNIADSAICVGVGIYILSSFFADLSARRAARAAPA